MLNRFRAADKTHTQERFTVPAPDKVENPGVFTAVGALSSWLDSLPNANAEQMAKQITKALTLLNRYPGEINRLDLIELYRPYICRLCRISPNKGGALKPALFRQLMTEVAYGYKHVVNQELQQKSWLTGRKKLLTSTYFSIKFLSIELLLAYENYDATTANTWREILRIFAMAEHQDLLSEKVPDQDQAEPQNATVKHLMRRVLLLSLLDPSHLRPNEARTCYDYLNQYASLAKLEPVSENVDPAGRYILDLTSTNPPHLFDQNEGLLDPEKHRLLNLVPVSKQIQEDIREIQSNEGDLPNGIAFLSPTDAVNILKRILKVWHIRQERRSERHSAYGWVQMSIGISSIHHFLQQCDTSKKAADFEQAPDLDETLVLGIDMQQQAPTHVAYEQLRCRLADRSDGGMALLLPLPVNLEPKVGQLILIQEETEEREAGGKLAIIRRCLRKGKESLEIGVQFIPGRIQTITIRPITPSHVETSFQPAVVVNNGLNRPASMLTSKGLYSEGRHYVVAEGWPAEKVDAESLIESSPGFDWFRLNS